MKTELTIKATTTIKPDKEIIPSESELTNEINESLSTAVQNPQTGSNLMELVTAQVDQPTQSPISPVSEEVEITSNQIVTGGGEVLVAPLDQQPVVQELQEEQESLQTHEENLVPTHVEIGNNLLGSSEQSTTTEAEEGIVETEKVQTVESGAAGSELYIQQGSENTVNESLASSVLVPDKEDHNELIQNVIAHLFGNNLTVVDPSEGNIENTETDISPGDKEQIIHHVYVPVTEGSNIEVTQTAITFEIDGEQHSVISAGNEQSVTTDRVSTTPEKGSDTTEPTQQADIAFVEVDEQGNTVQVPATTETIQTDASDISAHKVPDSGVELNEGAQEQPTGDTAATSQEQTNAEGLTAPTTEIVQVNGAESQGTSGEQLSTSPADLTTQLPQEDPLSFEDETTTIAAEILIQETDKQTPEDILPGNGIEAVNLIIENFGTTQIDAIESIVQQMTPTDYIITERPDKTDESTDKTTLIDQGDVTSSDSQTVDTEPVVQNDESTTVTSANVDEEKIPNVAEDQSIDALGIKPEISMTNEIETDLATIPGSNENDVDSSSVPAIDEKGDAQTTIAYFDPEVTTVSPQVDQTTNVTDKVETKPEVSNEHKLEDQSLTVATQASSTTVTEKPVQTKEPSEQATTQSTTDSEKTTIAENDKPSSQSTTEPPATTNDTSVNITKPNESGHVVIGIGASLVNKTKPGASEPTDMKFATLEDELLYRLNTSSFRKGEE